MSHVLEGQLACQLGRVVTAMAVVAIRAAKPT